MKTKKMLLAALPLAALILELLPNGVEMHFFKSRRGALEIYLLVFRSDPVWLCERRAVHNGCTDLRSSCAGGYPHIQAEQGA